MLSKNAALVEALLFASGEPAEISRLCAVALLEEDALVASCEELEAFYQQSGSALTVLRLSDSYQLAARTPFSEAIRSLLEKKKNAPLSSAALEVLAIIAYNQPVTKAFVEQVRGVDCSGVINTLCLKGLLEETGRLDLPGRPLTYGTTANFLRCFGLSDLSDLPQIPQNEQTDSLKEINKDASVLDGQETLL